MSDREKLIELLDEMQHYGTAVEFGKNYVYNEPIADHLIANGVTVQKWIPISERLPELHTKVLCCGKRGGRFIAETTVVVLGGREHICWDRRNGRGCPEVTHWMPLPEPPKECE